MLVLLSPWRTSDRLERLALALALAFLVAAPVAWFALDACSPRWLVSARCFVDAQRCGLRWDANAQALVSEDRSGLAAFELVARYRSYEDDPLEVHPHPSVDPMAEFGIYGTPALSGGLSPLGVGDARLACDPWGRPWRYRTQIPGGGLQLYSLGPDGADGSGDDVVVAFDGWRPWVQRAWLWRGWGLAACAWALCWSWLALRVARTPLEGGALGRDAARVAWVAVPPGCALGLWGAPAWFTPPVAGVSTDVVYALTAGGSLGLLLLAWRALVPERPELGQARLLREALGVVAGGALCAAAVWGGEEAHSAAQRGAWIASAREGDTLALFRVLQDPRAFVALTAGEVPTEFNPRLVSSEARRELLDLGAPGLRALAWTCADAPGVQTRPCPGGWEFGPTTLPPALQGARASRLFTIGGRAAVEAWAGVVQEQPERFRVSAVRAPRLLAATLGAARASAILRAHLTDEEGLMDWFAVSDDPDSPRLHPLRVCDFAALGLAELEPAGAPRPPGRVGALSENQAWHDVALSARFGRAWDAYVSAIASRAPSVDPAASWLVVSAAGLGPRGPWPASPLEVWVDGVSCGSRPAREGPEALALGPFAPGGHEVSARHLAAGGHANRGWTARPGASAWLELDFTPGAPAGGAALR